MNSFKMNIDTLEKNITSYYWTSHGFSHERFNSRVTEKTGNIDATYGLKGNAAPCVSSTTKEVLLNGGVEQIVTPLNADMLEMIGIIPNY